jgi:hypothetical protein
MLNPIPVVEFALFVEKFPLQDVESFGQECQITERVCDGLARNTLVYLEGEK